MTDLPYIPLPCANRPCRRPATWSVRAGTPGSGGGYYDGGACAGCVEPITRRARNAAPGAEVRVTRYVDPNLPTLI